MGSCFVFFCGTLTSCNIPFADLGSLFICDHPIICNQINILTNQTTALGMYSGTCAFRVFWHPTNIYGPKVFLLTKIKLEYSDILYNVTHFPDPLVCRVQQVPPYSVLIQKDLVASSLIGRLNLLDVNVSTKQIFTKRYNKRLILITLHSLFYFYISPEIINKNPFFNINAAFFDWR